MIKLIKPYIEYKDVEQELREVFNTKQFTNGPYVSQFKQALASYLTTPFIHLTTSATTALSVCLHLLEVQKGDEVIVSDFSFPASVNVIENIGATPIFVDVDLATFNMLPDQLEHKITKKTKAVIFVDALGNPSGITEISRICQHYQIPLIEDAACSIGSTVTQTKVGKLADLTCFSFHPRKLLTTGEGGAIATTNPVWDQWLKLKLNHGAEVKKGKLNFIESGFNYRLPDIACLLGIKQLEKLDSIIFKRNKMRDDFIKLLQPLGFTIQHVYKDVNHNVQSLVFTVPKKLNRDLLIDYLKKEQIESTIGTYCLSKTPYYAKKYQPQSLHAPFLEENTITLPCHDDVDILYVFEKINDYMKENKRTNSRWI